jgi:hypothetical protein
MLHPQQQLVLLCLRLLQLVVDEARGRYLTSTFNLLLLVISDHCTSIAAHGGWSKAKVLHFYFHFQFAAGGYHYLGQLENNNLLVLCL